MSVLVTGGAGFIGSHLIERLLRSPDRAVICLDDFNADYDPAVKRANIARFANDPRLQVIEDDICDCQLLEKIVGDEQVTEIVHLAASANARATVDHANRVQRTNVGGTECILQAALLCEVRKVIHISSSSVYGRDAIAPFAEDSLLGEPLGAYAASKQQAEELCNDYSRRGLGVTRLRLFNVYGPRLRPNLAIAVFLNALRNDLPLPVLGDGRAERDFIHVDDVARAIELALATPGIEGEATNIGSGRSASVLQVIELLEQVTGKTARLNHLPADACDMPRTLANTSKAQTLLHFSAQIVLEDGLRQLAQSDEFNKNPASGGAQDKRAHHNTTQAIAC